MPAINYLETWTALSRLARARFRSTDDYYRFQEFQARLIVRSLERFLVRPVNIAVDLGSGTGGYASALTHMAKTVIASDRFSEPYRLPIGVSFLMGDAVHTPFRSKSVDIVLCASLIEHLESPQSLLAEIRRILTVRGLCYLSFPPFYSLNGGHQYKPFHWLGESIATRILRTPGKSYAQAFGRWGLYRLTVRQARRLIKESGLVVRHEGTRFWPLNMARIPWFGEVLCWHVEFVLGNEGSVSR